MPKRLGFKIALFFLAAAAVSPADADAIGKVTDVARKTTADAAGGHRELDLGSDVAAKDTVVTDTVGQAALRFVDETQLRGTICYEKAASENQDMCRAGSECALGCSNCTEEDPRRRHRAG